MDGHLFDRLAQGVATRLTRRRTLGGLLVGAAALLSGQAQEGLTARKRDKPVTTEGPCGNGSVKANRCKRNGQCCTGFCDKKKGKSPYGRCRCRKLSQSCLEDRNCCATAGQPMTCQENVCVSSDPGPTCVARDGACTATTDCCTSLTCMSNTCQVDCPATLEAHGCTLNGNGTWNCGNTGGHAVDLSGANLSACDLTNASFFQTDLTGVILAGTILTGANFNDANVTDAEYDNTTCPTGVNSDANGDTCCGEFAFSQVPTGCTPG